MSTPSIWVPANILTKAESLINAGNGAGIRDGLELLLKSDLSTPDNPRPDGKEAGHLVKKGFAFLANSPPAALDVPGGSSTSDIRKAYKKMALKYHPDKNPKTTALFQAIQTASDRLCDPDKRKEAEKNAQSNTSNNANSSSSSSSAPRNTTKPSSKPYDYYTNSRNSANDAKASGPKQKKEDDYFSQQQQARDEANAKFDEYAKAHFKKAGDAKYAAFDAKFRQWKDGEDQARKHKDDILRQGQRAYFEEQQKARERERQREREKEESEKRQQQQDAYNAAKKAPSNSSKPSMTPDEMNYQKNKNNLNSFNNNKASNNSGSGSSSSSNNNNKKGPYSHFYGTQSEIPGNIGKTFTANSNGDVRMNDSSNSKPKSGIGMKEVNESIKYFCRPYGLKCTSLGSSSVDIEWNIPIQAPSEKMSFEVSWRNLALGTHSWESASKLIKTKQVRKKNLVVGASYEFRVRSVLELAGGMLGDRSEWSGSITVKLLNDSSSQSSPSKQKDNKSKPDNNKSGKNSNNNKNKDNPFHEDEGIISSDDDALENTARQAWGRTYHQEVEEDDELKKFENKFKDYNDHAKENERHDNNNPEDEDWYDLIAPPGQYNYEHKVYTEPKLGTSVVGYLTPGMCVISKNKSNNNSGGKNWLYVHTHKTHTPTNYDKSKYNKNSEWGWSMISDALHQFLVRVEDPLVDEELDEEAVDIEEEKFDYNAYRYEPNVDEWIEEIDPSSGSTYYYNRTTGESQWNPPEWIEEVDPSSGAAYYLKMDKAGQQLHSTWSRPIKFARIIRQDKKDEHGSKDTFDYTQDFEDFED